MSDIDTYKENTRDSVRSKKDYFLSSIRETDTQIKKLFEDIIEERKNTQKYLKENFEKVVTPSGSNAPNISFTSLGNTKLDSKKKNGKEEGNSANTSALLEEEKDFEDTFTIDTTQKKEKPSGNKREDNIKVEDHFVPGKLEVTADPTLDLHSTLGSPIDPSKLIGSHRKEIDSNNKFGDSKKYSAIKKERFDDDDISAYSGNRLLDTLKSDDFALATTLDFGTKRTSNQAPVFQVSKQELNFGVVFPTETRQDSFEIFNKSNRDLDFEATVFSEDTGVNFVVSAERDVPGKQRITFRINKFSFATIQVTAITGVYRNDSGFFNANIRIKCEDKESSVKLTCEVEKPMLQLLNSVLERIVGQVPFIQYDPNGASDSKMQIMFRNNGKKNIQLEFELVEDPRLAEILFSPKYLTLTEGEEKPLVVRMVSHLEEKDKKRAILKYKIRGTKLSQCLVINLP